MDSIAHGPDHRQAATERRSAAEIVLEMTAPDEENDGMSIPQRALWQGATILLYVMAAGVGLVATLRSFDRSLDVALVVWTFGMIAGFFACVLTVTAALSFVRRDDDRVDLQSFVGVLLFLVSIPVTTGGWGGAAAASLFVAWIGGRMLRLWHRRQWRAEFVERREVLHRLGKSDPRADPAARRLLGGEPSPGDATGSVPGADGGYATTRSELKRRAREIDQDPWSIPSD